MCGAIANACGVAAVEVARPPRLVSSIWCGARLSQAKARYAACSGNCNLLVSWNAHRQFSGEAFARLVTWMWPILRHGREWNLLRRLARPSWLSVMRPSIFSLACCSRRVKGHCVLLGEIRSICGLLKCVVGEKWKLPDWVTWVLPTVPVVH